MADSNSKIDCSDGGKAMIQLRRVKTADGNVLPTSHVFSPVPPVRPTKSEGEAVLAPSAPRPGKS